LIIVKFVIAFAAGLIWHFIFLMHY